jgi:hypothetical protein
VTPGSLLNVRAPDAFAIWTWTSARFAPAEYANHFGRDLGAGLGFGGEVAVFFMLISFRSDP